MKDKIKDNNRWIYADGGAPVATNAAQEEDWSENAPPEGVIENPNFGAMIEIDYPDPPTFPRAYDKADFKTFCYGVLGALAAPTGSDDEKLAAGIAAQGTIMLAMETSDDPAVHQCLIEYNDAAHLEKPKTLIFLGILEAKGIINTEQLSALSTAWASI